MEPTPIDRTRPLKYTIRPGEGRILEYLDDPGRWYVDTGIEVSVEEARQRGADVGASMRKKKLRDLLEKQKSEMAEFEANVEQKVMDETEELSDVDAQKVDPDSIKEHGPNKFNKDGQLRETGRLKMHHVGGAKFHVFLKGDDGKPGGEPLSDGKLSGAGAVKFMLDWHADEEELSVA